MWAHTIRHEYAGEFVAAKVLQVSTSQDDAEWTRAALINMTGKSTEPHKYGVFIPYQWRKANPKLFYQMLTTHNAWINNTQTLAICGVTADVMNGKRELAKMESHRNKTVKESLLELKGQAEHHPKIPLIFAVERTLETENFGKYFVVYHKGNRKEVYDVLDNQLPAWCNETKLFETQKFQKFPIPRRMIQDKFQEKVAVYDQIAQMMMRGLSEEEIKSLKKMPTEMKKKKIKNNTFIYRDRSALDHNHKVIQQPENAWLTKSWAPAVLSNKSEFPPLPTNTAKKQQGTTQIKEKTKYEVELEERIQRIEEAYKQNEKHNDDHKEKEAGERHNNEQYDMREEIKIIKQTIKSLQQTNEEERKNHEHNVTTEVPNAASSQQELLQLKHEIEKNWKNVEEAQESMDMEIENKFEEKIEDYKESLQYELGEWKENTVVSLAADMAEFKSKLDEKLETVTEKSEALDKKFEGLMTQLFEQQKKLDQTQQVMQNQIDKLWTAMAAMLEGQAEMKDMLSPKCPTQYAGTPTPEARLNESLTRIRSPGEETTRALKKRITEGGTTNHGKGVQPVITQCQHSNIDTEMKDQQEDEEELLEFDLEGVKRIHKNLFEADDPVLMLETSEETRGGSEETR